MRKVFSGILAAVIVLSAGTSAFAAGPGRGRCFTDADRDGICDNAGSACVYADVDGDGLCDVCSLSHAGCLTGDGMVFVDADGDGICDGCGSRGGWGR